MGEKYSRGSLVTSAGVAVLLAGLLSVSVVGPAASRVGKATTPEAPYADFTLSSFNVLGSSHTPAGGRKAPGTTRIKWVVKLMDRYAVDVVGFQEMQGVQLTKFLEITAGRFEVYPGFELKKRDSENSIAWSTDMWELVTAGTVTIPYFDGNPRSMPVVLLRSKATGITAYFANFHHAANTRKHRNQGRYRAQSTAIEIALVNELHKSGVPIFITGDMNTRGRYFCRMTDGAPMKAARGGTNKDGLCKPEHPRAVDWIFGSKRLGFSDYVEDRTKLLLKTSDHPMIVSGVRIDSAKFPNATTAPTP